VDGIGKPWEGQLPVEIQCDLHMRLGHAAFTVLIAQKADRQPFSFAGACPPAGDGVTMTSP
jgi:hypothetical protein